MTDVKKDLVPPRIMISGNGDPDIQISCVSNMYVRMMHFRHEGDIEKGHTHPFDHLTLLAEGSLTVEVDGVSRNFDAPKMIFIRKDKVHQLTALRDNTVAFCIHALRDGSRVEDIIDPEGLVIPPGIDGITYIENHFPNLLTNIVDSKL